MLNMLFLLFQLNYSFTFGYIPVDTIKIYEAGEEGNYNYYFADFYSEIIIMKTLFISGDIKTSMYETIFLRKYIPYQLEFETKVGIKLEFIEIGFSHFCIHPMYPFSEYHRCHPPKYEGGRNEIYVKFSNKNY